jgi:hypothetical protein
MPFRQSRPLNRGCAPWGIAPNSFRQARRRGEAAASHRAAKPFSTRSLEIETTAAHQLVGNFVAPPDN